MHVDEVLWHGEDEGTAPEISHRFCIMRKVIRKEVVARGRSDFFWALMPTLVLAKVLKHAMNIVHHHFTHVNVRQLIIYMHIQRT